MTNIELLEKMTLLVNAFKQVLINQNEEIKETSSKRRLTIAERRKFRDNQIELHAITYTEELIKGFTTYIEKYENKKN